MYSMLILDDEKIVLQGIQKLCQKEDFGFVIKGAFVDSLKALDALPGLRPHLSLPMCGCLRWMVWNLQEGPRKSCRRAKL